jgi:hypothetical protein
MQQMRFVKSSLGVAVREGIGNERSDRKNFVWEVKKDQLHWKYNVGCNTDCCQISILM